MPLRKEHVSVAEVTQMDMKVENGVSLSFKYDA
jgi:hypothetical protein